MSLLSSLLADTANDPTFVRAKHLAEEDHEFIRQLVEWRERRHLTQADIADLMGISPQAVSKFERYDGDHKLSSIRRYANAIGVVISRTVRDDAELQASAPGDRWDSGNGRVVQLHLRKSKNSEKSRPSPVDIDGWVAV